MLVVVLGKSRSCSVSFGWPVAERLVVRRRRASLQSAGNGVSMKKPLRLGVDFPWLRRIPLRDPASSHAPRAEEQIHITTS